VLIWAVIEAGVRTNWQKHMVLNFIHIWCLIEEDNYYAPPVGLASHWPRVTDISGSPRTGSRPRRGRCAPVYALLVEYGELYLYLTLEGGGMKLWWPCGGMWSVSFQDERDNFLFICLCPVPDPKSRTQA